jgi:CheY-like chemotaxis protein
MNSSNHTTQPVLYAEDDDNDVFLMERAFDILKVPNPLKSVSDGKKAMAYLSGTLPSSGRITNPMPCLMLLDLSMPGKNGIEVLQWVRTQPMLHQVPVVVLSSSNHKSDIHRAYLLGASGFFIKPGDPDELLRIVSAMQQYWLDEKPVRTGFLDIGAFRPAVAAA